MKEKITPGFYAVIPADVRYAKNLNANAKLLYGEITALCNKEGYCWASNTYFAELYGCTPQSISNWIQELVSQDFIRTENFPERGNLRHIYLNHSRNQQTFDFEEKTAIKNGYIVPNEIGELSNSVIEVSKSVIELSNSVITNNNTINTTSNIKSSSRNDTAAKVLPEEEIQEWIKQRYRRWFNRPDMHPIADVGAVHKAIIGTYTQDIKQDEVFEIVNRAFERVVQEKPKKDWLTREVLIRIKWMIEDYFKAKEKQAAKEKTEAIKNLKPGDAGLWNPNEDDTFKQLLNKKSEDDKSLFSDSKPKLVIPEVDKTSLEYRRKVSLFNQAVSEGK